MNDTSRTSLSKININPYSKTEHDPSFIDKSYFEEVFKKINSKTSSPLEQTITSSISRIINENPTVSGLSNNNRSNNTGSNDHTFYEYSKIFGPNKSQDTSSFNDHYNKIQNEKSKKTPNIQSLIDRTKNMHSQTKNNKNVIKNLILEPTKTTSLPFRNNLDNNKEYSISDTSENMKTVEKKRKNIKNKSSYKEVSVSPCSSNIIIPFSTTANYETYFINHNDDDKFFELSLDDEDNNPSSQSKKVSSGLNIKDLLITDKEDKEKHETDFEENDIDYSMDTDEFKGLSNKINSLNKQKTILEYKEKEKNKKQKSEKKIFKQKNNKEDNNNHLNEDALKEKIFFENIVENEIKKLCDSEEQQFTVYSPKIDVHNNNPLDQISEHMSLSDDEHNFLKENNKFTLLENPAHKDSCNYDINENINTQYLYPKQLKSITNINQNNRVLQTISYNENCNNNNRNQKLNLYGSNSNSLSINNEYNSNKSMIFNNKHDIKEYFPRTNLTNTKVTMKSTLDAQSPKNYIPSYFRDNNKNKHSEEEYQKTHFTCPNMGNTPLYYHKEETLSSPTFTPTKTKNNFTKFLGAVMECQNPESQQKLKIKLLENQSSSKYETTMNMRNNYSQISPSNNNINKKTPVYYGKNLFSQGLYGSTFSSQQPQQQYSLNTISNINNPHQKSASNSTHYSSNSNFMTFSHLQKPMMNSLIKHGGNKGISNQNSSCTENDSNLYNNIEKGSSYLNNESRINVPTGESLHSLKSNTTNSNNTHSPLGLVNNNNFDNETMHSFGLNTPFSLHNKSVIGTTLNNHTGYQNPTHKAKNTFQPNSNNNIYNTISHPMIKTTYITSSYSNKNDYSVKLDEIASLKEIRTTVMIRNIPNKYTVDNVLHEIDEM